jgi:hypothetical protein
MLGNYRVASRVVLSSIELVGFIYIYTYLMMKNSRVAAHLAASQRRLSSVESFVYILVYLFIYFGV